MSVRTPRCEPITPIVAGSTKKRSPGPWSELERHRREHAQEVAVREEQHRPLRGRHPVEHPRRPRPNLLRGLAARHRAGEDRPARIVLADLVGRQPLVLAVVPLDEVVVDQRIGEAGEPGGLTGPQARARQHQREPLAVEHPVQRRGLAPPVVGERDVGAAGVAAVAGPFGRAVPDHPDVGLTVHGAVRCSTPSSLATTRSVASPRKRPCSTMPARRASWAESRCRILDRREGAVEDPVALVGDEDVVVGAAPDVHLGAHVGEVLLLGPPRELHDLDGQRVLAPEARRELGRIDDDDLAQARLRDDLLAEQRTAAALDQVELGVDLVRAVDRQVDDGVLGQRRERDADLLWPALRSRSTWGCRAMFCSSPDATRSPMRRIANNVVLPVPSPTTIPDSTKSTARSLAACFSSSRSVTGR